MKFSRVLHVNSKEIAILAQAMQMYRAHIESLKLEETGTPEYQKRFLGYRSKVINMEKVLKEIQNQPNPEITEKGKIPERDKWEVRTTTGWKGTTT